jgi:ABC-2 type transport system permease protein
MRSVDVIMGELNLLRREQIMVWIVIGLLVAMLFAAFSGRLLIAEKRSIASQADNEAQMLIASLKTQAAGGADTARSAGAVGYSVLAMPVSKAATPLEGLAIGQNDFLPETYRVTARGAHTFFGQSDPENSLRLALGNFDVAFIVIWVLPLLAIGLFFDIVVGERERGVLALASVAGASVGRIVRYKWWSRFSVLALLLAFALFLSALLQQGPWGTTTTFVLTGWIVTTIVYLALWCALALYVSTVTRSSESAATYLAGAWLVFVVLVPAIGNLLVTSVVPPPSRVELTATLREATEQADKAIAAQREQWFFDHPDVRGDMDRQAYYASVARSEAEIDKVMSPLLAEFAQNSRDQQRIVESLKYLSPSTLTFRALTALSGSDGDQHAAFRDAVIAFHEKWRRFFVSRIETAEAMTAEDYDRLPVFEPPAYETRAILRLVIAPMLVMLGLTYGLCFLASRRLRNPEDIFAPPSQNRDT